MPVSQKLSEGYVIEYADKGKFQLAVISGVEAKSERLRLVAQNGREVALSPKQVTHVFELRLDVRMPVQNSVNALNELSARADFLLTQCDCAEIWEMFRDAMQREVTLDDVAGLCFDQPGTAEKLATIRLLRNEHTYFKAVTTTQFVLRDELQVHEIQRQQEFKKNIERERAKFASNVAKLLSMSDFMRREAMEGLLADKDSAQPWRVIESYALQGTECPARLEAEAFLDAAQNAVSVGFSGTSNIKAQNFLRQCGYWNESTNVFLLKYKIPQAFEESLEELAGRLMCDGQDLHGRENLQHLNVFSIDDEETRDIDDALSIEALPDGNVRVSVHIAAPQTLIPFGSPLEVEARHRATSVYLPAQRIPMFPKCLSEDAVSLVANQVRAAMSFRVIFDSEYHILSSEIVPSTVCVKYRLTYDAADHLLEFGSDEISDDLRALQLVTEVLQQNRLHNGAIDVDLPEIKVIVDPETRIVSVKPIDSASMSRAMVSECMILTNVLAADFCQRNNIPVMYRTQDVPHNLPTDEELSALPSDLMRSFAIRRCMMPAASSMIPGAHAALGVERYIQATSPIRRYSDLFAHYQIEHFIRTGQILFDENIAADRLNAAESAASDVKIASRETCHYELMRYLKQEMEKPQEAIILQYNSDKGDQASIYLTLTQIRATVSTRKRYPVGSSCLVQVESVHPEEDTLILKFLAAVE